MTSVRIRIRLHLIRSNLTNTFIRSREPIRHEDPGTCHFRHRSGEDPAPPPPPRVAVGDCDLLDSFPPLHLKCPPVRTTGVGTQGILTLLPSRVWSLRNLLVRAYLLWILFFSWTTSSSSTRTSVGAIINKTLFSRVGNIRSDTPCCRSSPSTSPQKNKWPGIWRGRP